MPRRCLYALSQVNDGNGGVAVIDRTMPKTEDFKLGIQLRNRRRGMKLTLQKLSNASGVSPSHIGRIERGQRFPSANILKRIAKPLSYEQNELFVMAGYLSPEQTTSKENHVSLEQVISQSRASGLTDKTIALELMAKAQELLKSAAN